jgi:diaminopimelate decarboxylase
MNSESQTISSDQIRAVTAEHPAPFYIYSKVALAERAEALASLELPFGLTVRYAVKANPHSEIIRIFQEAGLSFDASSSYEAANLLGLGIPGNSISLSSQQPAHNLSELLKEGVQFVATSMRQLELVAAAMPHGGKVGLRVNAGVGSGHSNGTTTAGRAASFGLWHEYVGDALHYAHKHNLAINRLHTHIGSGADPAVWGKAIDTSLAIAERMPDVTALDMGGGYKVRRAEGEQETDMPGVAAVFSERLQAFAQKTGRQLHLEIEPGTWLVAHAGSLVTEIVDIVDTGAGGFTFLRTNTGMNDFMRPTLHGGQHGIELLGEGGEEQPYVIVGHNCESSDVLTTAPGDPETIQPRTLPKARIGDLLVIRDAGAYGASLRAKGYNAFPNAREFLV